MLTASVLISKETCFFLFLCIVLLGVNELLSLAKATKTNTLPFSAYCLSAMVYTLPLLSYIWQDLAAWHILLVVLPALCLMFQVLTVKKNTLQALAVSFFAPIYLALPFLALFLSAFYMHNRFQHEYNGSMLLGFFILLWSSDTGAYISGRFLGKHKLLERISPKKTWEGLLGGTLLSLGAAWLWSDYNTDLARVEWLFSAGIIVFFGTFGDLFESLLKRQAGVKDSGKLLPGHGGILDRFDSVLLASPAWYAYLLFLSTL